MSVILMQNPKKNKVSFTVTGSFQPLFFIIPDVSVVASILNIIKV